MAQTSIFTSELNRSIQIAQSIAREYQHANFSPAHLLRALLHEEIGVTKFLKSIDKEVPYLREWAEVRIENYPKASRGVSDPTGDDRIVAVLDEADTIRLKLGQDNLDPLCVLAALSKPNVAFTKEQLKTFPLTADDILDTSVENALIQEAVATIANSKNGTMGANGQEKAGAKSLHKFCIDKTSLAKEGKIDPIIGRDRETRMMIEILGRRTKPNVLIVGEPGVGKTALVDGFALSIIADNVPTHLQKSFLYELDTGALVAGASYKGEVEDRLKSIIKELKALDKAILFIDEIHTFLDSSGPVGSGAANLLKPELARGEITVIGATTNDEYREFIEPEQAFNRRFEVLRVEEPDVVTATRMLQTLIPFYEQHHNIAVADGAAEEAVTLARRYVKDRRLPDAAIDLLDRTMAAIRMADETSAKELASLKDKLVSLNEGLLAMADLRWFNRELNNRISPILLSQLEEADSDEELDTPEALFAHLTNTLDLLQTLSLNKKGQVDKIDLAAVVAHKTGIPLGKIQTKERDKLLGMEEILQQRVIGQDQAIKVISEAILESRSGLTKPGQPIGSFFFLGPTGTGKTELAKSLADFLFNDETAMIRFDMSEFKEEHSAALLYGAPPGYVGYKEGGLLVNKIREKPYAVLLFDEVEKAHPSVFDVFLQILDEGKLHDRLGKEGDFSNAVILFTSNIGSNFIVERFEEGELPASGELMEIMSRHFRPEFLARVTEIVPFAPITESNVVKIFNIHLKKLIDTLTKQGITLSISDEARQSLALAGFNPRYGARPLTGVIRNQLRRPISRMIIAGKVGRGSHLTLKIKENQELVWEVETEKEAILQPE
ncbi:ATPase AAA [Adhaeribacter aerolatus]|uniref:ATPase AAA n=1 Tax=Adhaeribacter aerolatus TaxID=670289 RepID=A0A512AXC8_9BACT|nr:ATP-dependent Clp protease ATP-binding subunit [Adhaeribacter aerolatus]GEO04167.1 ATPase AAA [Adhaeribacter aerolatus]